MIIIYNMIETEMTVRTWMTKRSEVTYPFSFREHENEYWSKKTLKSNTIYKQTQLSYLR